MRLPRVSRSLTVGILSASFGFLGVASSGSLVVPRRLTRLEARSGSRRNAVSKRNRRKPGHCPSGVVCPYVSCHFGVTNRDDRTSRNQPEVRRRLGSGFRRQDEEEGQIAGEEGDGQEDGRRQSEKGDQVGQEENQKVRRLTRRSAPRRSAPSCTHATRGIPMKIHLKYCSV